MAVLRNCAHLGNHLFIIIFYPETSPGTILIHWFRSARL